MFISSKNTPNVSLEIIPEFRIYSPEVNAKVAQIEKISDSFVKNLEDITSKKIIETITHFPVILVDGSPWKYSTRYFLSKSLDYKPVKPKTLIGIARDLKDFKFWVLGSNIDYLKCEKVPQSPVRRYRRYLHTTNYSDNVIRRKLSRVVSFYRWLQTEEKIVFEKPLWKEREFKVLTTAKFGNKVSLEVRSTDVQNVRGSKQVEGNGYDGFINDGGLLRPFGLNEQKMVMRSLAAIGNTEMTLSFLIALTTGARLQTVFTLRKGQFEQNVSEEDQEVVLYVGRWPERKGSDSLSDAIKLSRFIDTKNSKPMKLYFPVWVYQKVQTYLKSERYLKRAIKSNNDLSVTKNQYVFLTTRARPFYLHSEDPTSTKYLNPPQGASVQQFISKQLKPHLKLNGFDSHFKFHNLRATYGMNIVRSYMPNVGKEWGVTLTELFAIVKNKMGHSHQETTQHYLSFDLKQKVVSTVQDSYEQYLDSLFTEVKGEGWEND